MRFLILFLLFFPCTVFAAQFEKFILTDDPSAPTIIQLKGEIKGGDAGEFERLVKGQSRVTLVLEGGLLH